MKKLSSFLLALLIASNAFLCSCGKAPAASSETTSETATATTTEETTTTAETTEETTTVSPFVTYGNPKDSSPYQKIELDGNKATTFVSKDYCYIESKKYVVFMDKDIKLPGDFAVNLDAIVDEIENQLGIKYNPEDFPYNNVPSIAASYYEPKDESGNGPNPWEGWDIGDKIPIFLVTDRKDTARISVADSTYVVICSYELFSNELWNSVPTYKKNPKRRNKYVDYSEIAHEVTHLITLRNCDLTNILTEGIAEYMGYSVISALASKYPAMATVKKKNNWDLDLVHKKITAKNAEKVFIADFHTLKASQRGPEYAYGYALWKYLYSKHGKGCFNKFHNELKAQNITYNAASYDKATVTEYAAVLKKLYGKDLFTKFGKWCVKKKLLQQ